MYKSLGIAAALMVLVACVGSKSVDHHTGGPHINNALIPPPTTKFNTKDLVANTTEVAPDGGDGWGAFRISCRYSHMSYDDPIVYPGQPGKAHLHTFFGNTAANAHSTAQSLVGSGGSTCNGGTINRSAYWVPSLIDTTKGKPLLPREVIFYYKSGGIPASKIQVLPPGLRMIAGDMHNSSKPPQFGNPFRFHCETATDAIMYDLQVPSACASGNSIMAELEFPQCWDGKNLDSPDHKSHMAYNILDPNRPDKTVDIRSCPSSHPVALPLITFNIYWPLPAGVDGSMVRFSSDAYDASLPAGWSYHGDWFNGWNPDINAAWTKGCLQAGKDCHAHLLGDGREMTGLPDL